MAAVTNQIMLEEMQRRGWQAQRLGHSHAPFIRAVLPDGSTHYFYGAVTEQSSAAGMRFSQNKLATYLIAGQLDIPVADYVVNDPLQPQTAESFCENQLAAGHEVIVKPINTDHGIGITVGIKSLDELREALAYAGQYSSKLVVQRRHYGNDCRVTVVDGRCVATTMRRPATVVGNGRQTLAQLVVQENERRLATNQGMQVLLPIKEKDVIRYHGQKQYRAVLAEGVELPVSAVANFGRGGVTEDITDTVHQSYKDAAIGLAAELKLMVCGVDFLTSDHYLPLSVDTAILLEINCSIGLRLQHYPTYGKPRNVAAAIIDTFVK